jgi:hypothetical protein
MSRAAEIAMDRDTETFHKPLILSEMTDLAIDLRLKVERLEEALLLIAEKQDYIQSLFEDYDAAPYGDNYAELGRLLGAVEAQTTLVRTWGAVK